MPDPPVMDGADSASSFWAQKANQLKTTTRSPPRAPKPSQSPSQTTTQTKKGLLLKVKSTKVSPHTVEKHGGQLTNGISPCPSRKTNWADSDEDEEFLVSISTNHKPHDNALDEATQTARVEEMKDVVDMHEARIQQLEDVGGGQQRRIADLEAGLQVCHSLIEQFKHEHHTQSTYVQELVAVVDEKNRRIHGLETELDDKGARIHELELELSYRQQLVINHSSVVEELEAKQVANSTGDTNNDNLDKEHQVNNAGMESKNGPSTASEVASPTTNSTVVVSNGPLEKMEMETLVKKRSGPAANDSQVPKLWSPDAAKKVAPVEKPKVLKMAIDTSKFGKKTKAVKQAQPLTDEAHVSPGQPSRHRGRVDELPAIDVSRDVRHLPHAQRMLFANGPEVDVLLGRTKLATLPKYILMQCSGKAHKYFTANPSASSITFPEGCMDIDQAKAHLQWMDEMTYQGRVYSLTLNADEKFDEKNLKICRAARVIGMNNTYVGHFTKVLCDRVRSPNLTFGLMSLICEMAYPENDPIFECLVNTLINQQLKKCVKKPEDVEKLVSKYPVLKTAMERVQQRLKGVRNAEKRKNSKPRAGSKNRADGKV